MVRVYTADPEARIALSRLVGIDVRFTIANEAEADVVVTTDLRHIRQSRSAGIGTQACVLLTDELSPPQIRAALDSGVRAIVPRDSFPHELGAAIEAAAAG